MHVIRAAGLEDPHVAGAEVIALRRPFTMAEHDAVVLGGEAKPRYWPPVGVRRRLRCAALPFGDDFPGPTSAAARCATMPNRISVHENVSVRRHIAVPRVI